MGTRRRCGFGAPVDQLSANDRREVERFRQLLTVEAARRKGADPSACDMLEAAIYPEGIGRAETKAEA